MLKKRDENQEKVMDEAYYSMKLEQVKSMTKSLSLMVRGEDVNEGTYQIWSSCSDDEETDHPPHGAMSKKHESVSDIEENVEGDG